MRIVIHTINYRPELTGIGKYTTEMCEWLVRHGHDVTVITPPPYYPQWRVEAPYHQWRYGTSHLDGVRVRRAPIWIPRRPGGLSRIAYALSFALSSLPLLLLEALRRPDLVLVIQPSFLNSPVAWLAARLGGARAWLHVQDFEIDLAYDLGQLKRGRRFAAAMECWMARRFDVVSTISERMLERARRKGIPGENLFLLPNWFDSTAIFPTQGPSPFRAQLGIPGDSPVALFSGSLGAKQGVETILQAAPFLADLDLHFVICGEGVAQAALKTAAKDSPNIHFLPLQPVADLNDLLNLADVHLLPLRKGTTHSIFPSKLIGMLASGRPVVTMAAPGSEIADLMHGCGISVDHNDVEAFAGAIRRLATNPEERQRMGVQARTRALERFRQDVALAAMNVELSAMRRPSEQPVLAHSERRLRRTTY
jgi:putative colanic acid biosynthesis glycosyltransferase WcaI